MSSIDEWVSKRVPKWFDLKKARKIQKLLADKVQKISILSIDNVDLVTGLDVAYLKINDVELAISSAVTYSIREDRVVEYSFYVGKIFFPYIPTLLSFRELTPMIRAFRKLRHRPQIVLIDGHGLAHPYRLGIASHFGVVMKIPTIGIAKSLLYGNIHNNDIIDPKTGEVIGKIIKCMGKTLYVSVGNLISLEDAYAVVEKLCKRSTLPIPLREAHNMSNRLKNEVKKMKRVECNSYGEVLIGL